MPETRTTQRLRGRAAVDQRDRRLASEDYLCRDCREADRVTVAAVVDHIIPLAKGGTDDDSNTRPLCDDCHRKRTAEQFGHKAKRKIGRDGWPED